MVFQAFLDQRNLVIFLTNTDIKKLDNKKLNLLNLHGLAHFLLFFFQFTAKTIQRIGTSSDSEWLKSFH